MGGDRIGNCVGNSVGCCYYCSSSSVLSVRTTTELEACRRADVHRAVPLRSAYIVLSGGLGPYCPGVAFRWGLLAVGGCPGRCCRICSICHFPHYAVAQ